MKGTEPVDTMSNDGMPEGRLRKDGASKDGLLGGSLCQDFASTRRMPEGTMPKCTMPKGGMPTDTVPGDGTHEGSLSNRATQGTLQKGPQSQVDGAEGPCAPRMLT